MWDNAAYLVWPNGSGYVKIDGYIHSSSIMPFPIAGFPQIKIKTPFVSSDYIFPHVFTSDLATHFIECTKIQPVKGARFYVLYGGLCFVYDLFVCKWQANEIDKTFTIIPHMVLDPSLHPEGFVLGIPNPSKP
ncbi:MAG: hypothetical protein K0Q79_2738 [Flavipsychrobacter sp.]|nr:hypothetical protein [Flavipsychrobacter sp.]